MIRSSALDSSRRAGAYDASGRQSESQSAVIRKYQAFVEYRLPLAGIVSAGLGLLGNLPRWLPSLRRADEPSAATLRDLGLGHDPRSDLFGFAEIHPSFESSRMRSLEASQGWRGS